MPEKIYTLTQHSKFLIGRSTAWAHAVETAWVPRSVAGRIHELGGVTFDSYTHADNAEYATNYSDHEDIYPYARGSFKDLRLTPDTYRIYIPKPQDLELYDSKTITYNIEKENTHASVL
jgi:hypothetical protein